MFKPATHLLFVLVIAIMGMGRSSAATQTDTISVYSTKMKRALKTVVVVPQSYLQPGDTTHYPTVYLLHGYGGQYFSWSVKANLDSLANVYQQIIVCPDGQDSWYIDSPIDPNSQFETYISKELPTYIDNHYRTRATPSQRAITGLSMGGHGAMWNGLRHPDVFGSCGTMSGGLDVQRYSDRWALTKRLGEYQKNKELWRQHSVLNLVQNIETQQNILIDEGWDDIFTAETEVIHHLLKSRGIKHVYVTRPGAHTWDYWITSLPQHLQYFSQQFNKAH